MIEYDVDYYYNLLRIHADTARMICKIRWDFIEENINEKMIQVLDYGCGVGFMKAFAPKYALVDTFDIMPVPQTGLRTDSYDLVMLYDVLEHIPDFTEIHNILKMASFVVLSVPMKPGNIPWKAYKHFKPGEHLHYFTHSLLVHIFSTLGFKLVKRGIPECPPREFVYTYLFKREEKSND